MGRFTPGLLFALLAAAVPAQAQSPAFSARWSATTIAENDSATLTVSTTDSAVTDDTLTLVTLHVGREEGTADPADVEVRMPIEVRMPSDAGVPDGPRSYDEVPVTAQTRSASIHHNGGWLYVRDNVPYSRVRTRALTLTVLDDADAAGETLAVWVYVNGWLAGAQTLTFTDAGEAQAAVSVGFGAAGYTAAEGGAGATVRVDLDPAPGRDVTIPITRENLGGATDADYSGVSESLTFGAADTSRTFTVTAADDSEVDPGESVRLGFGTPLPSGVTVTATGNATATVTITDNDAPAADTTAPMLSSAVVDGATLTLSYDEALDAASVPAAADFTVRAGGAAVALAPGAPVAVSGRAVTLTLAAAVVFGQTVTLSYAPGGNPIRDAAGNPAAGFTNQAVINQTSNNPPTAADAAVTVDEDSEYVFQAADFDFADADAGHALAAVKIVSLPADGELRLNDVPLAAGALPQAVPAADLGGNLVYAPPPDANGASYASFGFRVNDGTDDSVAAYVMTVDVTPVDDAPDSADSGVSTPEDTDYVFGESDFGFADPDEGDTLAGVKIVSLPARGYGVLQFNGAAIPSSDLPKAVTAAELGEGKLVYSPVAAQFGDDHASFRFSVSDGGSDSGEYTMRVSIAADPRYELLVGNLGLGGRDHYVSGGDTGKNLTQGFRTGDSRTGYDLRAVGIRAANRQGSGSLQSVSLAIYDSNADGTAKNLVYALPSPWPSVADIPNDSSTYPTVWFPAPAGATLSPDTDYHVAIQTPGGSASDHWTPVAIASGAEAGAPGWSIADELFANGVSSERTVIQLAVRGRATPASSSLRSDPHTAVSFASERYAAIEGEAGAKVTVKLAAPDGTDRTDNRGRIGVGVYVISRGGGATAADHSPIPGTLWFEPGQTTRSFTVSAVDDALDDDGESVTVGLRCFACGTGISIGETASATVDLIDADLGVSFDAAAYTAAEGGAGAAVTVTLSATEDDDVLSYEVPLTVAHNGGAEAADYSGVPESLTFGPNDTSKSFTVTAVDDAVIDGGGETVTLGFGPLGVLVPGAVAEAVVALADNDAAGAMDGAVTTPEDTDYVFGESDFGLTGPAQGVKIVSLPARGYGVLRFDGAAIPSSDLPKAVTAAELRAGMLVYSPVAAQFGDDHASFRFSVSDGALDSGEYTMRVSIAGDPRYELLVGNLGLGAIERYVSGGDTGKDLTQGFHTGDSSSGYELRAVGIRLSLTFLDGSGELQGLSLAIYDSNADGTAKDLVYALPSPWPSVDDIPNDGATYPTVWFPAPAGATLDPDTDYHVAIQTPGGSGRTHTVPTTTASDAEAGAPGWSIADELFANGVSSSNTVLRIAVRGRGGANGVSFGSGAYAAVEGGAGAEVSVTLTPAPAHAVTIPLTLAGHEGGATAADHSAIPASLTFPPGRTTRTFTVNAVDDDTVEDDGESVTVGFGTLPAPYTTGLYPSATVSLADNDESVSFDADAFSALEGGAGATVAVTLSAAPGTRVEVPLTVVHNGGAEAADYTGAPASLTFGPDDLGRSFTVSAVDDMLDDDGEGVTIGFGPLPAPYGPGAFAEAAVALFDDDAPLAANGRVSTPLDTGYAFAAADFMLDGADGDTLAGVTVVTLPARGALTLDGLAIAETDLPVAVARAQLDAGGFVYTPPAGEFGEFAGFTFKVNDGRDDSASAYAMTVDVGADADVVRVSFGKPAYSVFEGGDAVTVAVTLSRAAAAAADVPVRALSYNWGAGAGDHGTLPEPLRFEPGETSRSFVLTAPDDADNDDGESVTLGFGDLPAGFAAGAIDRTTVALVDDESVLVSNVGQGATPRESDHPSVGARRHSIEFTTGPDPRGYAVSTVEVHFQAVGDRNIVMLRSSEISFARATDRNITGSFDGHTRRGRETGGTYKLTPDTSRLYTLDPVPAGLRLLPSTRYEILTGGGSDSDNVYWRRTDSTAEDASSAAGWEIADTAGFADAVGNVTAAISPLLFRVNGDAAVAHAPADVEAAFGAARYTAAEGGPDAEVEVFLRPAPRHPVTIPLSLTRNGGAGAGDHSAVPEFLSFAAGQGSASFTVRAIDDREDDNGESLALTFGALPAGFSSAAAAAALVVLADDDGAGYLVGNLQLPGAAGIYNGNRFPSPNDQAMGFVTADHPYGYELTAVDIRLYADSHSDSGAHPPPGLKLAYELPPGPDAVELTGPALVQVDRRDNRIVRYTAPPGAYLYPGRRHWVVMDAWPGAPTPIYFYWSMVGMGTDADPGSAAGWSIDDHSVQANTQTGELEDDGNYNMFAVLGAPLTAPRNLPATGAPGVSNAFPPMTGRTLSAEVPGAIADPNGLTMPGWTYQWVRGREDGDGGEDIPGATGARYTLAAADIGHTVRVRVSFTDDGGHGSTVDSAPTGVVVAGVAATSGTVAVPAGWALIPPESNLAAGDRFRLMFVTADPGVAPADRERWDLIDAAHTDIEVYNGFVQLAAADGHPALRAYAGHFRALASTAAVDARANTDTEAGDVDTKIYWLGHRGTADDSIAEFWDATRWKKKGLQQDEDGAAVAMDLNDFVWTGTDTDGGASAHPLGSATPTVAEPNRDFGQVNNNETYPNANEYPLYAVSGVFEVAAAPSGNSRTLGQRARSVPAPGTDGGRAPNTDPGESGGNGPGEPEPDADPGELADDGREDPSPPWGAPLPHYDVVLPAGADPTGLWSDGETLWVIDDRAGARVTAYPLPRGARPPAIGAARGGEVRLSGPRPAQQRLRLTGGSGYPAGLWSDGETLWVADYYGGVRAYRLADGVRAAQRDIGAEALAAAGNHQPTGLWSDGETLWVADHGAWKVFAYALADRARLPDKEFDLADATGAPLAPWGLWSDGETALVSNPLHGGVLGYGLADGGLRPARAADAGPAPSRPLGLWSDGETLWVVNEGERRIRAYATPGLRREPDEEAPHNPPDPYRVRVVTRLLDLPAQQDSGAPVYIPDPALQYALSGTLGLAPDEPVRSGAMAALQALDLRGAGIADLTGLEHARNLEALDLGRNPVADLTVLTLLPKLNTLNLDGVAADLAPLAGLVTLERLSLRDNNLTDVTPLSGLVRLTTLDLAGNHVDAPGPLAGLPVLEALRLE